MKTNKLLSIVLLTALFTGACKQNPIEPVAPEPPVVETPSKGDADFSKFVALGDSYVAGAQGGTLFDASQASSLPKILADQFATVGGGVFNQPDVAHPNGLNFIIFGGSAGTVSRGRYILFDADGDVDPDGAGCATSRSAAPVSAGSPAAAAVCPSSSTTPAIPAPYNTNQTLTELLTFTGDRSALNNFGVPGTRVYHTLTPIYGNPPGGPTGGSPWFFRFNSAPGTSTMISDASTKGHKFFMLTLGIQDILSYAGAGAAGNPNPPADPTMIGGADMTPQLVFDGAYDANLGALLTDPTAKGVVTTIPDFTTLPLFFTVTYNNIEFKSSNCNDAALIGGLNSVFGSFNSTLDLILAGGVGPVPPGLTAEDIAKRKVVFAYGKNPILINDETLIDLGPQLGAASPIFAQFGKLRPATAADMILLNAGSILGVCAAAPGPGNPVQAPPTGWPAPLPWLYGLGAPLKDQYVILPSEKLEIQTRTDAFNAHIKAAAATFPGRVAVADVDAAYKKLLVDKIYSADGVTLTPSFAPPGGMFSEDGVHPNSRGYAFTANVIIDAINTTFNAKIPKANLANYSGTAFPVKGQ